MPFLSDNEAPDNAKPDAHFIPRQNPRALVIQTMDHRSAKSPIKEVCLAVHENGIPHPLPLSYIRMLVLSSYISVLIIVSDLVCWSH